ncbi:hypothetical protein NM688_g5678 [Phlebia brevispora]|uniref:Uncharacterized protein n=1 Tax=Phlebia brevispora TaxID=194682 RepID=A0ACC1SRP5_9APHY|nr:hypothetical protein NM688_g5678 [Phlebia brevispora]
MPSHATCLLTIITARAVHPSTRTHATTESVSVGVLVLVVEGYHATSNHYENTNSGSWSWRQECGTDPAEKSPCGLRLESTAYVKLGQRTYIDENALQPGQVTTYWGWGDVHHADQYLTQLEALRNRNASSLEVANFLQDEFQKLGIPSATQQYSFHTSFGVKNGTNAYAVLSSPRASGTEAMVISASRLSRTGEGDGTPNLRGIATVLSLAAFLKNYSLWAKDLIFVISDDYLEGMQAWITTYHGVTQSNLITEPLKIPSGVIWTALNIDYPGHSFSHLGVFFEGLNGRLPNQDLINSFERIARHTGGVPVTVYDHIDHHESPEGTLRLLPQWVPSFIKDSEDVKEYIDRARNVLRHVGYQARGRASGVHGLLHQFRIDAFTIYAVPAQGPHGFHAIGRIVESTLRTMNNLLERLHASFFFYLLVGTNTFMKIGSYLPSAVLVSTAMLFSGLGEWVKARWVAKSETEPSSKDAKSEDIHALASPVKWVSRPRPVLPALSIMITTHLVGIVLFYLRTQVWFMDNQWVRSFVFTILTSCAILWIDPNHSEATETYHTVLKAMNLCLASTVISITSVLNFSLAAVVAITLGLPLTLASPSPWVVIRLLKFSLYSFLALGWLILGAGKIREETMQAIWNWEFLGVWFAPFVCMIYTPFMMQAAIVCLLPP